MDHRARDSWMVGGGLWREGKKGMCEVSEIFLISNNAKANRCHFSTSQSQSSLTLTLTLASVVAAVLQHVHSQRQPRARARGGRQTRPSRPRFPS